MQVQSHFSGRAFAAWCLVIMVLIGQMDCNPVPDLEREGHQKSLRRSARMTPLWRIMGSKPQGAYCQNNYECSTGICKKGHCSLSKTERS